MRPRNDWLARPESEGRCVSALPPESDALLTATQQGRVAQLVEQGIENPRVGGSIPSPATLLTLVVMMVPLMGSTCFGGDKCEQLCVEIATRVARCKPDSLQWEDLGAERRQDFISECRRDWERERLDLSASELAVALEFCDDTVPESLTCEEVTALYGPIP